MRAKRAQTTDIFFKGGIDEVAIWPSHPQFRCIEIKILAVPPITVTTEADEGRCGSLRQAITDQFRWRPYLSSTPNLDGKTITLAGEPVQLTVPNTSTTASPSTPRTYQTASPSMPTSKAASWRFEESDATAALEDQNGPDPHRRSGLWNFSGDTAKPSPKGRFNQAPSTLTACTDHWQQYGRSSSTTSAALMASAFPKRITGDANRSHH